MSALCAPKLRTHCSRSANHNKPVCSNNKKKQTLVVHHRTQARHLPCAQKSLVRCSLDGHRTRSRNQLSSAVEQCPAQTRFPGDSVLDPADHKDVGYWRKRCTRAAGILSPTQETRKSCRRPGGSISSCPRNRKYRNPSRELEESNSRATVRVRVAQRTPRLRNSVGVDNVEEKGGETEKMTTPKEPVVNVAVKTALFYEEAVLKHVRLKRPSP